MNLPDPALLLVTDRKQARTPLADVVERALAAGCRWVSLREKDLPELEQIALLIALKPLAQRFSARLTLHGDPRLVKASGLDGVHLSGGSDAAGARELLGRDALIGISIHSLAEAERLDPACVDYAIAGPAFATASKPGYGPFLGPHGLRAMAHATVVPIVAIGGIEPGNVSDVLAAGTVGIAVMGGIMRAADPGAEVFQLLARLKTQAQPRPR